MNKALFAVQNATGTSASGQTKPVPMKLFATWEVDRTPSNCIARLCSLTLVHLIVSKPLGTDITSIWIAVKMQSSKRTLRSNEIVLPQSGLLDTTLEMTFSLQYPHFLKRDGNRLQVLLQRRKRYKNRTMLGFKTLAEGVIRMDQVLQKPMDLELELFECGKEKAANMVAKLSIMQLSSTPVDQDQKMSASITDRGFSDEEDEAEFTSGEEEGQDMSDSEPMRNKLHHTRHNFKQRFVSLLRRFRAADSDGSRAALGATSDIQALFNELDSLSCDEDSVGEQDTMSISSTPKPSLRPFFSSSRSLHDNQINNETLTSTITEERNHSGSDGNPDVCWTDPEAQSDPQTGSPPQDKDKGEKDEKDRKSRLFRSVQNSANKKKYSISISGGSSDKSDKTSDATSTIIADVAPRKSFMSNVNKLLAADGVSLPEWVVIADVNFSLTPYLDRLPGLNNASILQPLNSSESRAVLQAVFNKLHKYSTSCTKSSLLIKLLLIGGDQLCSPCVRHFIELVSSKSNDWLNYFRLYVVPYGVNSISKQISALNANYASLFSSSDLSCNGSSASDPDEFISRIQRYIIAPVTPTINLPLAEAMLTCHDESKQIFLPFISEVRVGSNDAPLLQASLEIDDQLNAPLSLTNTGSSGNTSNSIVTASASSGVLTTQSPPGASLTPPSSPNVQIRELLWEPLDLQIDYWQASKIGDSSKNRMDNKNSLKGSFKSIHVYRTPGSQHLNLTVNFSSKEKKQKIMRLGKKKEKDKDSEPRSQVVESITRLICSSRTSQAPLKVYIDGCEWSAGVKFFQLSATWQTHVKYISVVTASG